MIKWMLKVLIIDGMDHHQRPAKVLSCVPSLGEEVVGLAASALHEGKLVVFPTETVYGLGANALDEEAVQKIYQAKGRPPQNPLIVHVGSVDQARHLSADWPEVAEQLARRFWPGPLSLVVPRAPCIPDAVSAGLDTIAIRSPAHPVALQVIQRAEIPVAAPSANPSGYVSPTRVEHLAKSIIEAAEWVLDAGPCPGGIESTVVDVTVTPPRVLRPGLISREELASLIGDVLGPETASTSRPRSPGLLGRHYAPRARVVVIPRDQLAALHELAERSGTSRFGCLLLHGTCHHPDILVAERMPTDVAGYAHRLYDALVRMDRAGVDIIVVEEPPDGPEWDAIRDRLRRAALW